MPSTTQYQVLIIAPPTDFVKLLCKMLFETVGTSQLEISTVSNVEESLQIVNQTRIDYIFVDTDRIKIKELTSLQQTVTTICSSTQIVALSFHKEEIFRTQLRHIGIIHFLVKDEIESEDIKRFFDSTPNLKAIYRPASAKTPCISLNPTTGEMIISGRSFPEDAFSYYYPLRKWMKDYTQNPATKTVLDIDLEYCNSNSVKKIVLLLKELEVLYKNNHEVTINWHCFEEDEDMVDTFYTFQTTIYLPFNLVFKNVNHLLQKVT